MLVSESRVTILCCLKQYFLIQIVLEHLRLLQVFLHEDVSGSAVILLLLNFCPTPPPGLTYDEVISFVPPPLDQEEMESWETALFCLSHFTVKGRPFHRDSPIIVQVPHHNNILLSGGVLCVLNWGGRGEGRKLSLCKHAACSCILCTTWGKPLETCSDCT